MWDSESQLMLNLKAPQLRFEFADDFKILTVEWISKNKFEKLSNLVSNSCSFRCWHFGLGFAEDFLLSLSCY